MKSSSAYTISTDQSRLDAALVHRYLSGDSYWARGVPLEVVERAIQNSLCFGMYQQERQVGFARVVTDAATFGYLADVFIVPDHRGGGLGKQLIAAVMAHPTCRACVASCWRRAMPMVCTGSSGSPNPEIPSC